MRRTRIVATIGPESATEQSLRAMLRSGLDVARINFSHGTHETQAKSIALLRQLAASESANLPIIADLQGPKVRVGTIADAPLRLPLGGQLILTVDGDDTDAAARQRLQDYAKSVDPETSGSEVAPVRFAGLAAETRLGDTILFDDGLIAVEVIGIRVESGQTAVVTRVVRGGELLSGKAVVVRGRSLNLPSLTAKDWEDVRFAVEQEVDWVALSYVRSATDVEILRQLMLNYGAKIPIIAKIETQEAIANFDDISGRGGRHHGGAGRSGRASAAGRCPVASKGHHSEDPHTGKAGHHRHADARVDDAAPRADAGRGQRRGECNLGW